MGFEQLILIELYPQGGGEGVSNRPEATKWGGEYRARDKARFLDLLHQAEKRS